MNNLASCSYDKTIYTADCVASLIAEGSLPCRIKAGPQEARLFDPSMTLAGLAVNCSEPFFPAVGVALAAQSGTYGLCWYLTAKGECQCTLYSAGLADVGKIARLYGGEGTAREASVTVSVALLTRWLSAPRS